MAVTLKLRILAVAGPPPPLVRPGLPRPISGDALSVGGDVPVDEGGANAHNPTKSHNPDMDIITTPTENRPQPKQAAQPSRAIYVAKNIRQRSNGVVHRSTGREDGTAKISH
uniref:Uncharacterized protein n=1 Tax=Aegilops tauschii TaxID=37682 RepID=N1R174_AEGTA